MRWKGHVARMVTEKCVANVVENLKERNSLEDLVVGGQLILKYI